MPRTVLIVDDERDVNDLLAKFVEARDFEAVQRFAGATVVVIPILLVFLGFQRRVIEGIATTGIK